MYSDGDWWIKSKWLKTRSQRYSMKKNTLTVDPLMFEYELWMRQCEKPSQNCQNRFFENQTAETEFSIFKFWGQFDLLRFFGNWYLTFSSGSAHPSFYGEDARPVAQMTAQSTQVPFLFCMPLDLLVLTIFLKFCRLSKLYRYSCSKNCLLFCRWIACQSMTS